MTTFALLIIITESTANPLVQPHFNALSNVQDEVHIPVSLYDSFFKPNNASSSSSFPPRYLVGMLGIPPLFRNLFTFDLGNPAETILNINYCKGCDVYINDTYTGCPDIVPSCTDQDSNASICWKSNPAQTLPFWSYEFHDSISCSDINVSSAGNLLVNDKNISTCRACFDAGDHSRFYALARPFFPFHFLSSISNWSSVPSFSIPTEFVFGALVRTVPRVDRIWSNVGIGFNSSFLQQMKILKFMLLNHQQRHAVILHPGRDRYENAPFMVFDISRHRLFKLDSLEIRYGEEETITLETDATFMMDTGNDGISIENVDLKYMLSNSTDGVWLPNDTTLDPSSYGSERLYIPAEIFSSTTLSVNFNATFDSDHKILSVPITKWIYPSLHPKKNVKGDLLPTIFSTYDKNVLGLPFLSTIGVSFVFDDESAKLYFVSDHWNFRDKFESS